MGQHLAQLVNFMERAFVKKRKSKLTKVLAKVVFLLLLLLFCFEKLYITNIPIEALDLM